MDQRTYLAPQTLITLDSGDKYVITGSPIGAGGGSIIYPVVRFSPSSSVIGQDSIEYALKECYPASAEYRFVRDGNGQICPSNQDDQAAIYLSLVKQMLLSEQNVTQTIYKTASRMLPVREAADHATIKEPGKSPETVENAYVVMESLSGKGRSLHSFIQEQGRLSPAKTFRVIQEVLFALREIHEAGFLHLDIQDGNVFIRGTLEDESEIATMIDFGSARPMKDGKTEVISDRAIFTTQGFSAPELLLHNDGTLKLGPETDIYSVGCLALYLLTGNRYSTNELMNNTSGKYLTRFKLRKIQCPPHLVDRMQSIIGHALAKEPENRYHSVNEMLSDVSDFVKALQPYRSDLASTDYSAFVCYKHGPVDSAAAIQLQRSLEHFRWHNQMFKREKHPIERVFVDEGELSSCADFAEQIRAALRNAGWLIVICSPDTPSSPWVNLEIDTFLEYHDRSRILAVLTGGEPEISFPKQLLGDKDGKGQALAADARGKDSKAVLRRLKQDALLKIAAPILGTTFDSLKQRQRIYALQRGMASAFLGLAIVSGFLGYAINRANYIQAQSDIIAEQSRSLEQQNQELKDQARQISSQALDLERQNTDLERQSSEIARQASDLEQKNTELEEQAQQISAQAADLEQQNTDLERQGQEISKQANDLEQKNQELQSQAKRISTQAADLEKQNTELEKQSEEISRQAADLQQQNVELEKQSSEIAQQASALESQNTELEKQSAEIMQQASELQQRNEQLEAQSRQIAAQADQIVEETRNTLLEQSRFLTSQSTQLLASGDRIGAIEAAVRAVSDYQGQYVMAPETELALVNAVGAYVTPSAATNSAVGIFQIDSEFDRFAISDDGGYLFIGKNDGTVEIWDANQINKLRDIKTDGKIIYFASAADSDLILIVSESKAACYSYISGTLLWERKYEKIRASKMISPETLLVLSENTIVEIDIFSGEQIMTLSFALDKGFFAADFCAVSADQKWIAFAVRNKDWELFHYNIILYNVQDQSLSVVAENVNKLTELYFTKENNLLLFSYDGWYGYYYDYSGALRYSNEKALLECFHCESQNMEWSLDYDYQIERPQMLTTADKLFEIIYPSSNGPIAALLLLWADSCQIISKETGDILDTYKAPSYIIDGNVTENGFFAVTYSGDLVSADFNRQGWQSAPVFPEQVIQAGWHGKNFFIRTMESGRFDKSKNIIKYNSDSYDKAYSVLLSEAVTCFENGSRPYDISRLRPDYSSESAMVWEGGDNGFTSLELETGTVLTGLFSEYDNYSIKFLSFSADNKTAVFFHHSYSNFRNSYKFLFLDLLTGEYKSQDVPDFHGQNLNIEDIWYSKDMTVFLARVKEGYGYSEGRYAFQWSPDRSGLRLLREEPIHTESFLTNSFSLSFSPDGKQVMLWESNYPRNHLDSFFLFTLDIGQCKAIRYDSLASEALLSSAYFDIFTKLQLSWNQSGNYILLSMPSGIAVYDKSFNKRVEILPDAGYAINSTVLLGNDRTLLILQEDKGALNMDHWVLSEYSIPEGFQIGEIELTGDQYATSQRSVEWYEIGENAIAWRTMDGCVVVNPSPDMFAVTAIIKDCVQYCTKRDSFLFLDLRDWQLEAAQIKRYTVNDLLEKGRSIIRR